MTRPKEANKKGIKTAVPMADDMQSSGLKPHHVDAVVSAAVESHSPATRRAYSSAWKGFAAWCEAEGYQSLPSDPETLAAFLTHRAKEDCAISTIKLAPHCYRILPYVARTAEPHDLTWRDPRHARLGAPRRRLSLDAGPGASHWDHSQPSLGNSGHRTEPSDRSLGKTRDGEAGSAPRPG